MRSTNGDGSGRWRAEARRASSAARRALRRCAADEAGTITIEYLLVTATCGLLVAIGLIETLGPPLVSMWSDRRACLYDAVCLSPLRP